MPTYQIAMVVDMEADDYDQALDNTIKLAAQLTHTSTHTVRAIVDYDLDNDEQRIVYLHPADTDADGVML